MDHIYCVGKSNEKLNYHHQESYAAYHSW